MASVAALPTGPMSPPPRSFRQQVDLPQLRDELGLYEGADLRDGQPTWTLHDPVRNLYFQLDWLTFEVLVRWNLKDPVKMAASICAETTLHALPEDVLSVASFLSENQLIQTTGNDNSAKLAEVAARYRISWWKRLLHNYLFFRIPLVKPDSFLNHLYAKLCFLLTPLFFRLTFIVFVVGVTLVYRDWDVFSATLIDSFTLSGMLSYAITLAFVKILHELGHGIAAKHYGCRVPTMGLAFLVLWPMPYTDTNEAWKLRSHGQRLRIASAGVLTELMIAVWSTFAWAFLPDGLLRDAAFMLATTTWISTLIVNCSPFLRFDGYFVVSDFLGMPNLHARAFALARWRLRELLFAIQEPPPEYFSDTRRRGLIIFAYVTWLYRLFVFLGIAALVYTFFIKAIGILLFAVEILWFVLMPIYSEIKVWRKLSPKIRQSGRTRWSVLLVLLAIGLCFVPLPGRINVSGLLHPGEEYSVYAREGSRVEELFVGDGAFVKAGTPLALLSTEQIDQRLASAQSRVARYDAELAVSSFSIEQRARLLVRQGELQTAQTARRGLESQRTDYQPVARFDGQFRWQDPDMRPGMWVAKNEQLGTVVSREGWYVECYVGEDMVHRISKSNAARFYPDGKSGHVVELKVGVVDRDATRVLTNGALTSVAGGSVSVREIEGKLVPEKAAYRVILNVADLTQIPASQVLRGAVVIRGESESLALRFMRSTMSIIWREAGW
jgi:putative peptide zinc metalloprotease protein